MRVPRLLANRRTIRIIRAAACLALAAGSVGLVAVPAAAVSPDVVISQVYGGGGNSGAPYNAESSSCPTRCHAGLAGRALGAVRQRHRQR